ncbi:MAG TPA: acetyltransferase [Candidatus Desulfobacillus sp.]|nr:acetyltransferase [Candidatus Desulfobacillus sp.]
MVGPRDIGEAVRHACVEAALEAYEDAQIRGLCHEGAWEVAVGAMRSLDLSAVITSAEADGAPPPATLAR